MSSRARAGTESVGGAVAHKQFVTRVRGPGFTLGTWRCSQCHRVPGRAQPTEVPTINVVLRGAFTRHVGRGSVLADPSRALLAVPDVDWSTSHTCGAHADGVVDEGVWARLDPAHPDVDAAMDRARGHTEHVCALTPADAFGWASAAAHADAELAAALIADVVAIAAPPTREPAFVRHAKRVLADRIGAPLALEVLADEVGASPWHLCRTFRRVTGVTPRGYAEHLRLVAAARRIDAGCDDLAGLAVELGFASHSHLSARFKAAFGRSPSAVRGGRGPVRAGRAGGSDR